MAPGAAGPRHVVDREQVVVVLDGHLQVLVGADLHLLAPGDAVALPASAVRQLAKPHDAPLVTMTAATPGGTARVGDADPVPVPWAA
jgi:quercetin dioxygenase-like cupin family protein